MSQWDVATFLKNLLDRSADVLSGSLGVIELEHKRIHSGDGFNANKELGNNDSLEVGDKFYICSSVGDDPIHLKTRQINFNKSRVKVKIYEGADFDDENTEEIPAYAMNRVNIKESGMNLCNSTIVPDLTNADVIGDYTLQGVETGAGNRPIGNPSSEDNTLEYIYKANEKYVLELENVGAEAIDFLSLYWYWYVERE